MLIMCLGKKSSATHHVKRLSVLTVLTGRPSHSHPALISKFECHIAIQLQMLQPDGFMAAITCITVPSGWVIGTFDCQTLIQIRTSLLLLWYPEGYCKNQVPRHHNNRLLLYPSVTTEGTDLFPISRWVYGERRSPHTIQIGF